MKVLIADSGSTKTSWALVDLEKGSPTLIKTHVTMGLNPLYTTVEQIHAAAIEVVEATGDRYPDILYFYGAGCSGERINTVEKALRSVFMPSTRIEVASDLLAACRALGAGICCILGTGAIAARFDAQSGEMETACSLGYILGDEGSGAYFGRQILSDYLKDQMPTKAREAFEDDFGTITPESAISHVYQMQFPNRYLASFAVFVGRHNELSYCQQLAYKGVEEFFKRNVLRLEPSASEPISFVGSVAFNLKETIRQVAEYYGLQVGRIDKEPMQGLIDNLSQYFNKR